MDQTSIPLWDAEWVGYDPWVRRADELPRLNRRMWTQAPQCTKLSSRFVL